jgi:hypothetical protein
MLFLGTRLIGLFLDVTPVAVGDAVTQLTSLGIFSVIGIAAVLWIASMLYRRFRK